MENENPYMASLESYSDDEIFEIIANPDEMENPSRYTAALSIALKRELISEYQAENLLDGNTTVLGYNPNIIDKQVEDFQEEKEIHRKESRKKLTDIQYGLLMILFGGVLLIFAYSGELWFPIKTKIVGYSSIIIGFILLIIGLVVKWNRKKKMNTDMFNQTY